MTQAAVNNAIVLYRLAGGGRGVVMGRKHREYTL